MTQIRTITDFHQIVHEKNEEAIDAKCEWINRKIESGSLSHTFTEIVPHGIAVAVLKRLLASGWICRYYVAKSPQRNYDKTWDHYTYFEWRENANWFQRTFLGWQVPSTEVSKKERA